MLEDLDSLPIKPFTVQSAYFPPDMRCSHVIQTGGCNQGCYFLEKGGNILRSWTCKREDCQGHVYEGSVRENRKGEACFGKKGNILVNIR
jgi:hypothetical protein